MKTAGFAALIIVPLLFSCIPKTPEIPMTVVPAEAFLQRLEMRRQAFSSLRAVASLEVTRGGRSRMFDTVGVVVRDQQRFRLEAYGPLGQSLMAVVWDGTDILFRMPEEDRVVKAGPAGLERLLGRGADPAELCAVLSGNLPDYITGAGNVLSCAEKEDFCILELRRGGSLVRTRISATSVTEGDRDPRVLSYEVLRAGKPVFRVLFDDIAEISHYHLPLHIEIVKPSDNMRLILQYSDVEVNVPISEEAFSLTDDDGVVRGK